MPTYARVETKRCPMYDDACAATVAKHLSAMYPTSTEGPFDGLALIEKQCGRFTRGAHIGKLRGWAELQVVTSGGWLKDGYSGRVVYPNTVLSIEITDFNGKAYLSV